MSRKYFIFFLIVLMLAAVLLAGCGEKAECKVNTDCGAAKTCFTAPKCTEGKCVSTIQKGCCGNSICEADKGESYCSCEKDCTDEKCEGFILLEKTKYNSIYTKYLRKLCDENTKTCIAGVASGDVHEIPLQDEKLATNFKFSSVIKFNKPFDITKDQISIDLAVRDISADVVPPVKFTQISVISGEMLYADKQISHEFTAPGQSFSETIPISYVPLKLEEEKSIIIRIYYEYNKTIDAKLGKTKRVTETYENVLSERIYLVNPAAAKAKIDADAASSADK
jgi:hypothetical protein